MGVPSQCVVLSVADENVKRRLGELQTAKLLDDCLVVDPTNSERLSTVANHLAASTIASVSYVVLLTETTATVERAEQEEEVYQELRQLCHAANIELIAGVVGGALRGSVLPSGLFRPDWNYNLLVVPEDGIGVGGHTPTPLDETGVCTAICMVGALAGGLVRGVGAGFGHHVDPQFDAAQAGVRYAQAFVRIVDSGTLSHDVVELALRSRVPWPEPESLVTHPDPELEVERLADELALRHGLGLGDLGAMPAATRVEVGWRRALAIFRQRGSSYIRTAAGERIAEVYTRALTAIDDVLQRNTFGADADVVISLQAAPDSASLIVESADRVARIGSLPAIETYVPIAVPGTWRALRSVMFGLADGGDFSGEMAGSESTARLQRAVVGDLHLIANDPLETRVVATGLVDTAGLGSGELELGPHDPRAWEIIERGHQRRFGENSAGQTPSEESDPEPILSPDADSRSLGWKLAKRVSEGEFEALDALRQASDRYAQLPREISEAATAFQKSRSELLKAVIGTVVGVIAVLAAAVFLATAKEGRSLVGSPDLSDLAEPAPWIALLSLPVAAIGLRKLLRSVTGCFQAERRLGQLSRMPEILVERRRRAAAEASRLADLYGQVVDWADICGGVLHNPFGQAELVQTVDHELRDPPERILVVGEADRNDAAVGRLALDLRRRMVAPGWIGRHYGRLLRAFTTNYELSVGLKDDDSDPDKDTTLAPHRIAVPGAGTTVLSPRAQLRNEVLDAVHVEDLYVRERDELLGSVAPSEWAAVLTPINAPKVSDAPIAPVMFFSELLNPSSMSSASFPLWCFPEDDMRRTRNARIIERIGASHMTASSESVNLLALTDEQSLLIAYRVDLSALLVASDAVLAGPPHRRREDENQGTRRDARGYV